MTDANVQEYDLVILGSGAAGKLLSWTMASKGMKTAVIERKYVGGACPNIACLPSKNVIHSAKVASYFRRSEEFGIRKDNWTIDMATVRERKRKMVDEVDDIAEGLYNLLSQEGIKFIMNAQVTRVEGKSGASVKLNVTHNGSEKVIEGTHLLVAAGRIPNTAGIGLELAGVETTANGYIKVNDRLETTAADVWAGGEVAGSPQFTHISENDFHVVADNIQGGKSVTTGRQVPFVLFTDPEYARIGLSEKEAKERGIPYRLAKVPFSAVFRAQTIGETYGFMKALIDSNDRIIGFSVLGAEAGELMGAVQIAMIAKLPYTALRDAIFAHPTMVEGLIQLFIRVQA